MSRVGRTPIPLPAGVTVDVQGRNIAVKGKLGKLSHALPAGITVRSEGNDLTVIRSDDTRTQRALHGLTRTLIANMVAGVTQGYKKDFEIVGTGYRCELRGAALQLAVGFSHRVIFFPPEGIKISVSSANSFTVSGIDKQLVGDTAARIRAIRPPEPYQGKGIKFAGETIRRKVGKTAGK